MRPIDETTVDAAVRGSDALVGLSTASVYPESTASCFELAGRLGYDAVEVMVGIDPISQDVEAVQHLVDYHQIPVCAIHAPCLLITQRVWGTEPWAKLEKSAEMAQQLGADVVVVHPPFRWQRDYARGFVEGIARLDEETGVHFAVENMFPWRAPRRDVQAYVPSWNPVEYDFANVTLDLSHSATSGTNPVEMAVELGDRLRHVHLADGSGSAKDEHLVPGRGNQPCAEFLELLAESDFAGMVVVEINTRRSGSRSAREQDLAEALAYTRLNLVARADFDIQRGAADPVTQQEAP
ncbi:MAG: sugar phosphate isomerase/epimerase family protein [Nocardioidaceae bacterium]